MPVTRREMLVRFGEAGLGLSLPLLLQSGAAQAAGGGFGKAKSCIFLFLSGGASQYETWDPKPDAPIEYRGTFRPIRTSVPGTHITEHLPRLAQQAHRYSIIRSMSHTQGGHPAGCYWMITGRPYPRAAARAVAMSREDHPHYGSVLAALKPATRAVPSFVMLPEQINPNGPIRAGQHAGFLGPGYDPMVVNANPNAPDFTAGELTVREGLDEGRLLRRRALLSQANLRARIEEEQGARSDLQPHVAQAFDLLTGGLTGNAFDISQETAATRERYGRHIFGQSVLVARRLVESGVRLAAVNWVRHDDGAGGQGWDTHSTHLNWSKDELLPPTDRAISALLTDLADRGMLDETLVVVTGEFGRTPKFNADGGRDHWPDVFSLLVAGGGIRGGQVYGASTPDGAYPAEDACSPADLAATLYHCLGIPPQAEVRDRQDRPFSVADGEVLSRLL